MENRRSRSLTREKVEVRPCKALHYQLKSCIQTVTQVKVVNAVKEVITVCAKLLDDQC